MTITLPKGWGPATILVVLYAAAVVAGGIIEIAQGDLSLAEYLNTDAVKVLAGSSGLLALGRGAAYIGGDPGFAKSSDEPAAPDADVRR